MNDSPGRRSPGSPSDEPDNPAPEQPATPADQAPEAKWAPQQPPAGPWPGSGSGPQPPPGRPGWGQQPDNASSRAPGRQLAWGGGWTPPPAAPKPGVIPLRPLGVGEIIEGAFATMRTQWRTVLGVSLGLAIVTQAATTVINGIWFRDNPGLDSLDNDPDLTVGEALRTVGRLFAGMSITSFVGVLGSIIATAMLTVVVSRAVLGRSATLREAWTGARPQLLRMLGLVILVPLLILAVVTVSVLPGILVSVAGAEAGGAALALLGAIAGCVAAVWLWIRYSLAAPALMLEKQGVTASMRRSAKLVRGAWWRIFGVQLLAILIAFVVMAVVQIPTGIAQLLFGGDEANVLQGGASSVSWTYLIIGGLGALVGSVITFPITAGVTVLLYTDQRIRRESLDVELIRAANN
ncbi:glycerophosphoryl diester phosphodiesterase membrane domain-containing protein [Streptomyces varsoviensis]|uniref:glycerophosphoryl diester phosphodiesterase membrane domain-containing protein n=1 Tax=Streptomyces varsoviensis TaxID=67373 RepID=UPI0004C9B834|nr:glycerophosphoryl diester phosphodiesterase membrane domain-containing protein [Streptomyces varsoviensis]